jgi:hypothetical protein
MPEQFIVELKRLLDLMPSLIENAMKDLSPLRSCLSSSQEQLTRKKLSVFDEFSRALKRQISFMQIAKSCKLALSHPDNLMSMCCEIEAIDLPDVWSQMVTMAYPKDSFSTDSDHGDLVYRSIRDLIGQMRTGLNLNQLTQWVNQLVEKSVVNVS